jgi:hypothetical protein
MLGIQRVIAWLVPPEVPAPAVLAT